MKIRAILGVLLLISLVAGLTGVGAASDGECCCQHDEHNQQQLQNYGKESTVQNQNQIENNICGCQI